MTAPALRLLADIGGTHARFALQHHGRRPYRHRVLQTREFATLAAAIAAYLGEVDRKPRTAAIAVAAPITGDRVELTNAPWGFSVETLRRGLGFERLAMLNDFEALAWSLPALAGPSLRKIGRGRAVPRMPKAVLGPGTGLGVSCLVPVPGPNRAGTAVALATEGGHMTMAASGAREAEAIAILRAHFGHVSAERLLSGPGLANLYAALAELDGTPLDAPLFAGEIGRRARARSDPRAVEAASLFTGLCGQFAGDMALVYGARGGVYLGGGVIPRLGPAFDFSLFRRRFESKGRFSEWTKSVPTYLIRHPNPAMIGLARSLDAEAS